MHIIYRSVLVGISLCCFGGTSCSDPTSPVPADGFTMHVAPAHFDYHQLTDGSVPLDELEVVIGPVVTLDDAPLWIHHNDGLGHLDLRGDPRIRDVFESAGELH